MSSTFHALPQNGYHTDAEYAAVFEEEITTFRKKVKKLNIPYGHWGKTMVVKAEDLQLYFENGDRDGEEES